MDKLLVIICAVFALGMIFLDLREGALSVLVVLALTVPAVFLIRYYSEEKTFLTRVFLVALLTRLSIGLAIHFLNLRSQFGPDAFTYDTIGWYLAELWHGVPLSSEDVSYRMQSFNDSGWGMNYLVGVIYFICGRSMLAAQSFCAVFGALTAPMIYFCAEKFFHNQRVAKISAWSIALFPSFVIWSSQLLKDGLIIFLLVFTMTMVLHLQKKISYSAILLLILSLLGIISLRFYIFYMMAIAVAGSFVAGLSTSIQSVVRNIAAVVIIGLALTYLGVLQNATSQADQFGSLERVQRSRQALAQTADSGFGKDLDVSTPTGAVAAIPVGLSYLMLAPFPWQVEKLNQLLILPEMFVWWALIPLLISGLWFTIKYRLRSSLAVLIFTLMLTLAYSIFQGNVGMAYRQRTQIQVFLFIFIAIGWTLIQEKRENRKTLRLAKQQDQIRRIKNREFLES